MGRKLRFRREGLGLEARPVQPQDPRSGTVPAPLDTSAHHPPPLGLRLHREMRRAWSKPSNDVAFSVPSFFLSLPHSGPPGGSRPSPGPTGRFPDQRPGKCSLLFVPVHKKYCHILDDIYSVHILGKCLNNSYYFVNKGPSSQGYSFSSSHIWI